MGAPPGGIRVVVVGATILAAASVGAHPRNADAASPIKWSQPVAVYPNGKVYAVSCVRDADATPATLCVGAAPDAFASLTAKGRLDDQTSLTLTYDTRRLDAGREAFARTADPLDESQYAIATPVWRSIQVCAPTCSASTIT